MSGQSLQRLPTRDDAKSAMLSDHHCLLLATLTGYLYDRNLVESRPAALGSCKTKADVQDGWRDGGFAPNLSLSMYRIIGLNEDIY